MMGDAILSIFLDRALRNNEVMSRWKAEGRGGTGFPPFKCSAEITHVEEVYQSHPMIIFA
jgi:hypothetical protein